MPFRQVESGATNAGLHALLATLLRLNARPGKHYVQATRVARQMPGHGRFTSAADVNTVQAANPTLIETSGGGLRLTVAGLARVREHPQPHLAVH